MTRKIFLALACLIAAHAPALAQSRATVVILVRHAEKAAQPADDPPLTPAGMARAQALADALKASTVTAIITTTLTRTQQTAEPLAKLRNVNLEVVPIAQAAVHSRAVAEAVRKHQGETVLVVGHSNTIGAIIFALGGPPMPDICDSQYSDMFTLILDGPSTRMIHSTYGAPSPDPATTCAPMKP
jgi:phosphohistidine phosphatase SixA